MIVGLDEVGRGPLAGDVVAAAVILHPQQPIPGLTDSKKLTEKKREVLAEQIKNKSLAWSIGRASAKEIDEINILQASLLAMKRAYNQLQKYDIKLALVDGKHCPDLPCKTQAIIQGDLTEPAISAASIIAKVTRDGEMQRLAEQYPQYGFAKHKGYPTKLHLEALAEYGPCDIHRVSFAPVRKVLTKKTSVMF